MSTVRTAQAQARNGLPAPKPYIYQGTGTEMSPAETAAHLHRKDTRMTGDSEARVRASLPGATPGDDDLEGVVTRREPEPGDPVTRFAVHLGARMRALGWTQHDLAERAGVTQITATKAVNGTSVTLEFAGKLATLVGSDLATMIGPYICGTCNGGPPAGFGCLECGTEGERR